MKNYPRQGQTSGFEHTGILDMSIDEHIDPIVGSLMLDVSKDPGKVYKLEEQILEILGSDLNCSDIFIQQDAPIMVKLPRQNVRVSSENVSAVALTEFFSKLDPSGTWKQKLNVGAWDRSISLQNERIRIHCIYLENRSRLGAIIRRFPAEPPLLSALGLPQPAMEFPKNTRGLVLVIGDTGQGKSTTLAAMADEVNRTRQGHIVTIEDPIEITIPQRNCLITQREVGLEGDVKSFFIGAKDALRELPSMVVIGETRDSETAKQALALGESGPLVCSTLHAKSIEDGLSKLMRMLGNDKGTTHAVAKVLKGIVCQSLVPAIDGKKYYLATECMTMNPQLSKLIEDGDLHAIREQIQKFMKEPDGVAKYGCYTLNYDLSRLHKEKKISAVDARAASNDYLDIQFHQSMETAAVIEGRRSSN